MLVINLRETCARPWTLAPGHFCPFYSRPLYLQQALTSFDGTGAWQKWWQARIWWTLVISLNDQSNCWRQVSPTLMDTVIIQVCTMKLTDSWPEYSSDKKLSWTFNFINIPQCSICVNIHIYDCFLEPQNRPWLCTDLTERPVRPVIASQLDSTLKYRISIL